MDLSDSFGVLYLKDFSKFGLPKVIDFGLTIVMTSLIGLPATTSSCALPLSARFLNGRRYSRFGWRLNLPGLAVIALFFGTYLIAAVPYLSTERKWIERGESLSQLPLTSDPFAKTMELGQRQMQGAGGARFVNSNTAAKSRVLHIHGRSPVFANKAEV